MMMLGVIHIQAIIFVVSYYPREDGVLRGIFERAIAQEIQVQEVLSI
jgi:hypothetical protein